MKYLLPLEFIYGEIIEWLCKYLFQKDNKILRNLKKITKICNYFIEKSKTAEKSNGGRFIFSHKSDVQFCFEVKYL